MTSSVPPNLANPAWQIREFRSWLYTAKLYKMHGRWSSTRFCIRQALESIGVW